MQKTDADVGERNAPAWVRSGNPELLTNGAEPLLESGERSSPDKFVARLSTVWAQRSFLARVTLMGMVAALLLAFLIPKRYSSTTRLMPPQQKETGAAALISAAVGSGGSLMPLAEGAFGLRTTGDLFIGIIHSETVEDHLIRKFELQKLYGKRYFEDARKELADRTDVTQDPKSGIITITVTDHDPARASAMAEDYIHQLNWVVSTLNTSSAHRERVFLEQRLGQVKEDLETAEKQLSGFSSQKGAIDIQTQSRAMLQAAADLQGQMIAAESELQGLRQIYTPNNVRIRSLEARIQELRRQLQKIGGSGADENSEADEVYPSIRQLPLLGVEYADLLRRVKVQEAVFQTLTQQYEIAKVDEAKEIPTVKVLDPPEVPEKKSFPPRLIITILGGVLALTAGIAWVLGQSAWSEVDNCDSRKVLATQIWGDVSESVSRSRQGASERWLFRRIRQIRTSRAHPQKDNSEE